MSTPELGRELTAEVVKFISLVESLKAMCAREQDENARLRERLREWQGVHPDHNIRRDYYINTLKDFGPDMFNILYGIVAVTGWHMGADESFSPQGIVDLNNNLIRFHAIADQVISKCSNVYPSGIFPNLETK